MQRVYQRIVRTQAMGAPCMNEDYIDDWRMAFTLLVLLLYCLKVC
jgi:hypothetical protein